MMIEVFVQYVFDQNSSMDLFTFTDSGQFYFCAECTTRTTNWIISWSSLLWSRTIISAGYHDSLPSICRTKTIIYGPAHENTGSALVMRN